MRVIRIAALGMLSLTCALAAAGRAAPPTGLVRLDGRTVLVLPGGVGSIGAADRAAIVERRLQGLLAQNDSKFPIQVQRTGTGWQITIAGQAVLTATSADGLAEHLAAKALAERWAGTLQTSLRAAWAHNQRRSLWRRLLIILLILVLTCAALLALRLARRRLAEALDARRANVPALRFRGLEIVSREQSFIGIARAASILYLLAAVTVIGAALLSLFDEVPSTQRYAQVVGSWIWRPVLVILRGFVGYLPDLFFILVIIVATRLALRAITFIFEQAHRGVITLGPWLPQDVARPTATLFKAAVVVIALFFIAPLIPGTGTEAAKAIEVVIGLMISLGSSSTVGNLIAGTVLTYMRPFRLGDRVKLGEVTGDVMERTFLYTKLRTIKNEEVIVPSLQALGAPLVNYSAGAAQGGLILHTSVTIGYDAPWRRVHELLIQAALHTDGILTEPAPFVLQTALDDSYAAYQINAYSNRPNEMANIYGRLHQEIQDAFNEGGIEILSPHYQQLRDGNASSIPAGYPHRGDRRRFQVDTRLPPESASQAAAGDAGR